MRERPILFSDAMVRAILAGTKTQTRRVVGLPSLQPSTTPGYDWTWRGQAPIRSVAQQARHPNGCWQDVSTAFLLKLCPYGQPGDRLWVREAWSYYGGDEYLYQRDPMAVGFRASDDLGGRPIPGGRWRPSIHMPRWASRLTLEVTSVRVERLLSISEEDARAEGVQPHEYAYCAEDARYRMSFARLWDSINGERAGCAWKANPWVWVVGFEVRRG